MDERDSLVEPEPWGEDPKLIELLGAPGATGFRALFDSFPEAVGVLWAVRDAEGRIVDFTFGYGNPSILRAFRLPAATRDRYTLLEALPRMRGARAFDTYVRVCETGVPWVHEVTYDTPSARPSRCRPATLRATAARRAGRTRPPCRTAS